MRLELAKFKIAALSDDDFVRVWKCIEHIEAAVNTSGELGVLAIDYVVARRIELKRVEQELAAAVAKVADITEELKTLTR